MIDRVVKVLCLGRSGTLLGTAVLQNAQVQILHHARAVSIILPEARPAFCKAQAVVRFPTNAEKCGTHTT